MSLFQNRRILFPLSMKTVFIFAWLLFPFLGHAQVTQMPESQGKTLSGDTLRLPADANGKPVVLVFGFARSSKDQGVAWGRQLVALARQKDDFDFYQVAMLSRAPKFTRGMIALAIRAEVPPAYYSHTLLLTSGEREWRKLLGVKEEDAAYVAICSPSGEIQWQTKGVGEAQFAALRAHLHTAETELADNRPLSMNR
jgi:hypothetical protein